MKLRFLGTTGYHPNEQRHTACMLIAQYGIVLDAGTGIFRLGQYLETDELDIFVTHAHLDHIVGLTYLLGILHDRDMRRVVLHGEQEKLAAIDEHLFAEPIFPVRPNMQFQPLDDEVPLRGGGRLTHFPLEHPGGVVGYRLDWPDHSMAYVTDTTAAANADYVSQIRGVNLLVHECYFPDSMSEMATKTGHSCTSRVAEVARAADVGKLVMVHMNPAAKEQDPIGLDVARSIFADSELGRDEMEVEF